MNTVPPSLVMVLFLKHVLLISLYIKHRYRGTEFILKIPKLASRHLPYSRAALIELFLGKVRHL